MFEVEFAGGQRVRARFGLAVCRTVLRRLGGEIQIESEIGAETTATIQLPRVSDG